MRFQQICSVCSLLILLSCDPSRVYEKNIKIPDGIWYKDNKVSFEVFIDDTVSAHNLYVNVRNTSLYPFSNLYLFIETTAPSGHTIRNTFEVILADDQGKWLGSGLGDIWDLQQVYKENVRFAQTWQIYHRIPAGYADGQASIHTGCRAEDRSIQVALTDLLIRVGKGKLSKFEEMKTFDNVFQPDIPSGSS